MKKEFLTLGIASTQGVLIEPGAACFQRSARVARSRVAICSQRSEAHLADNVDDGAVWEFTSPASALAPWHWHPGINTCVPLG